MKNSYLFKLLILTMCISPLSLSAEGSSLGLGLGLTFDLGSLGKTIATEGLDSNVGVPALTNHERGLTGCNDDPDCMREVPGANQQLVVPENRLLTLENSTNQAFNTRAEGAMTGLTINVFWEKEFDGTFLRVGIDYTRKISGGETESRLAGIKWYDIHWDYNSLFVPVYGGIKARVGETSGVYAGAGLNYFRGGWSLSGYNFGDLPTYVLGIPVGASTVYDANGQQTGGPVIGENIKYRVSGIGINFVIGVEKATEAGNKIYIEIDRKIAFKYDSKRVTTPGGIQALAPFASYPINMSATIFRVGYKVAM